MTSTLIALPFRIGFRAAGLALHGATEVTERTLSLVGALVGALTRPAPPQADMDGSLHEPRHRRSREPFNGGAPASDDAPRSSYAPEPSSAQAEPESQAEPAAQAESAAPAEARPAPDAPSAAGASPSLFEATTQPSAPLEPPPAPPADPPLAEQFPAHVDEEPVLVESVAEAGAEDGAGAEIHVAEPWEGYRAMKAGELIDRINGASVAELAAVQLYEGMGRRRQTVLKAVERELRRTPSA